jgi:DNA-binding NtrC family response regulator
MQKLSLLIVEDDEAVGLNLVAAAEDAGARAIGPVGSVSEALLCLEAGGIDGAVIDIRLHDRDIMPVALRLVEKAVPFVVHSGYALPDELASMHPEPEVLMKPTDPDTVLNHLVHLVAMARDRATATDSALSMMVAALELLDAEGKILSAAHLQHAIDALKNEISETA